MKKSSIKRGLALILGALLALQSPLGLITPVITSFAATGSAAVNASSLNVRSGPGTGNALVAKLARGTAVTVLGEATGTDGKLWYQIRFSGSGGAEVTGYVLHTYIKFPVTYQTDANFESYLNAQGFPESYKTGLRELHAQYPQWIFQAQHTGLDWNTVIENQCVIGRNLVGRSSISSWKSTADGAYDWGAGSWPGFDGATWVAASDGIIRYHMDPRNFLDSVYVFQFLSHRYDASIHTKDGINIMVQGTFLGNNFNGSGSGSGSSSGSSSSGGSSGTAGYGPGYQSGLSGGSGSQSGGSPAVSAPTENGDSEVRLQAPTASIVKNQIPLAAANYGPGMATSPDSAQLGAPPAETQVSPDNTQTTPEVSQGQGSVAYVDIIMQAAGQSGVNPYVLAAMIIQEQGRSGSSDSISGTSSSNPGYFNFYNIGAFQSGNNSAVTQGLVFASQSGSFQRPWNTREKSIVGGAQYYGENYVNAGQDTFYLKKFNVQGSNIYKHQYMTNVQAAAAEASLYAEGFTDSLKQTALVFKIPVFTNMPEQASARPTLDGSPNNKLAGLSAAGFALTPTFSRDVNSYDLIVDSSVTSVTVSANAIDSAASVAGNGNIQLHEGRNEIRVTVTAGNGTTRDYLINVIRQTNGPTYNGTQDSGTQNSGTQNSGTQNSGGTGGPGVSVPPNGGGSQGSGGTTGGPGGSSVTVISPAG